MFKLSMIVLLLAGTSQIRDVSCALEVCFTDAVACSSEANSICEPAGTNCVCVATYVDHGRYCAKIACTTSGSKCSAADTNSYCETYTCSCKTEFTEPNLLACTRKTCTSNKDCKDIANSYCVATGTNDGCTCGVSTTADLTTGACTPSTTCTLANAVTTCLANAFCIPTMNTYQCQCAANYLPGAAVCVQRDCVATSDCDSDSTCDTTYSVCVCDSTFAASDNKCKKVCTGNGIGVCHSQATCAGGVCKCNVNYEGNGATCTQLPCIGSAVTTCHPNSKCSSNACACASFHTASGTVCKKTCTATSECHADATCTRAVCECKANYAGDGSVCTQISCSSTDATKCHANSVCDSANLCTCAPTFRTIGSICVKDCQSDATVCHAHAACSTSGTCECNINYVGDGKTCTQLTCCDSSTCSSNDADAVCVSSLCQCKQKIVVNWKICKFINLSVFFVKIT